MDFVHTFQRKTAQFVQAKPAPMSLERPVVTISFDDVPRSALQLGAEILEAAGVRGTYYVAGGLAGGQENGKPCHLSRDLARAHQAGHEIASHGFAHVSFPCLSPEDAESALLQNDLYLEPILGRERVQHFAYPFGECALKDKRLVASRFVSGRGVRGGLNNGICDLTDLRANALYEREFDERAVHGLIERAASARAWLIFFTHDIADDPSDYGLSPRRLKQVIDWSLDAGCDILPVREAVPRAFGLGRPH